jgi:hypothetical protein
MTDHLFNNIIRPPQGEPLTQVKTEGFRSGKMHKRFRPGKTRKDVTLMPISTIIMLIAAVAVFAAFAISLAWAQMYTRETKYVSAPSPRETAENRRPAECPT